MNPYPLPIYVQRFFTERLMTQLGASPNTVASYRDTFRLLLNYVSDRLARPSTELQVADIDADLVANFLTFIETERGNSTRSRNNRLAAIRSFFNYVACRQPELLYHCQRVLAIPSKRYEKRAIDYLNSEEIEALIAAPDPATWYGRRDRAIILLAVQTGLRVSELIQLNCGDVILETGAHVRCIGKGRKERSTPLRKDCVKTLHEWLKERNGSTTAPLFISNRKERLSRDAVERLVSKHAKKAASRCSTLTDKRVTPHVLRHSAAMQLLQNGVDRTVIALWLGHESVETTQVYIHSNLELKEQALAKTQSVEVSKGRYRPTDDLLEFLEAL